MLEILEEYPNIDNVISRLNSLSDKLSSRIKYLVLNFVESYNKKEMKEEINNTNLLTKKKILEENLVDSYNNLVMEYIINESIDDFMNALKNKIEGDLILAILRKYNPKCETKLLQLVNKLVVKNVINSVIINEKIKLYNENGILEDIAEECPIIYKFTEKLKNEIN